MSAPSSSSSSAAPMRTLALRKNEDRRLSAGHLWIFSNEVDVAKTNTDGGTKLQ